MIGGCLQSASTPSGPGIPRRRRSCTSFDALKVPGNVQEEIEPIEDGGNDDLKQD